MTSPSSEQDQHWRAAARRYRRLRLAARGLFLGSVPVVGAIVVLQERMPLLTRSLVGSGPSIGLLLGIAWLAAWFLAARAFVAWACPRCFDRFAGPNQKLWASLPEQCARCGLPRSAVFGGTRGAS